MLRRVIVILAAAACAAVAVTNSTATASTGPEAERVSCPSGSPLPDPPVRTDLVATMTIGAETALQWRPSWTFHNRSATVSLPEPTGPHPVGTSCLRVVDEARQDSWSAGGHARHVMAQTWYPARTTEGYPIADYVPRDVGTILAEAISLDPNALESVRVHSSLNAPPIEDAAGLPVVVVSPGYQQSRAFETSVMEDLASHGYVVVAVDHTYDNPVLFPDGRLVPHSRPVPMDEEQMRVEGAELALGRAADIRMVLDAITGPAGPLEVPIDPDRIGGLGASIGGAGFAELMRGPSRVDAAINLDGELTTGVVGTGLDKPFLILSSVLDDPSWVPFRENQSGPGMHIAINGLQHGGFSDLAYLAAPLGLPETSFPGYVEQSIGVLDGYHATALLRTCVREFLDVHVRGAPSGVSCLDAPETEVRWAQG